MMELNMAQTIAVWALPILFAITLHEVAHGYAAKYFGDFTAQRLGRLSLNPLKHLDPIGTVLLPLVSLVIGGFLFGWAKPVPINPNNLKNSRHMAVIAAAGPLANLVMGMAWAFGIRIGMMVAPEMPWLGVPLFYMSYAGITINAALMVLNLLPLPPLDGGRVLVALLPPQQAQVVENLEPWGFPIILTLLITGLLAKLMGPLVNGVEWLMLAVVGLGG